MCSVSQESYWYYFQLFLFEWIKNMLVKNVHSSTSTQVLNTASQYLSYSENDRKFQKVKFEIRQKE